MNTNIAKKIRLTGTCVIFAFLTSCAGLDPIPPVQDNSNTSPESLPSEADLSTDADIEGNSMPDIAIATPQSVERRPQPAGADVTATLRLDAQKANAEGLYAKAERLLDRAIRIAPRDPQNYLELAKLRLLQQQPAQAAQLARRGISLHPNDELLKELRAIEEEATTL